VPGFSLKERKVGTGPGHLAFGEKSIWVLKANLEAKPMQKLAEPGHVIGVGRAGAEGAKPQRVKRHVEGNQAILGYVYGHVAADGIGSQRGECEKQKRAAA